MTSTTASWKEVDVTAYVNAERAAGRTNVSFAVLEPTNGQQIDIASGEGPPPTAPSSASTRLAGAAGRSGRLPKTRGSP